MKLIIHGSLSRKSTTFLTKPQGYDSKLSNAEQRKAPKRARVAVAYRRLEGLERNGHAARPKMWNAQADAGLGSRRGVKSHGFGASGVFTQPGHEGTSAPSPPARMEPIALRPSLVRFLRNWGLLDAPGSARPRTRSISQVNPSIK